MNRRDIIADILHRGHWRVLSNTRQQADKFLADLWAKGYEVKRISTTTIHKTPDKV